MTEQPTPQPQNVTRRRFIKRSGGATVGTAIGLYALQTPAWAAGNDDSSVLTLKAYPEDGDGNIDDQYVTWDSIGKDNLTVALLYVVNKHDPSKVEGYQPTPEQFDGDITAKVRLVKYHSQVGANPPAGTNDDTGENSDGNMYLNHGHADPENPDWHKYTPVKSLSSNCKFQVSATMEGGTKKASVLVTQLEKQRETEVIYNGTKYKLGLGVKPDPDVGNAKSGNPVGFGLEYKGNVGWDENNPTNSVTIKWGGTIPPVFPNFEFQRSDNTTSESGPQRSASIGIYYSIEPKE